MKQTLLIFCILVIVSCSGPNDNSKNPVERAGSYVAGAIVTAAIIRAIFND